jgi:hypothetical protein
MQRAHWTSILTASLMLMTAREGSAQIGGGWQEYNPSSKIHLAESDDIKTKPGNVTSASTKGASFKKSGGKETFRLTDPISNRSERRMQNDYTSGRRQFEGEVRVSGPTNNHSVMQIFGGIEPATTQMIRAYSSKGGSLRKVPGSVELATGIFGKWVRVNVIHDVGANTVKTYINGQLKATGSGEAPSRWYHKYGCYGTLNTSSAKVEWRKVRHFQQGSSASFSLDEEVAAEDEDAAHLQEAIDLAAGPLDLSAEPVTPDVPIGCDGNDVACQEEPAEDTEPAQDEWDDVTLEYLQDWDEWFGSGGDIGQNQAADRKGDQLERPGVHGCTMGSRRAVGGAGGILVAAFAVAALLRRRRPRAA